jgi:hypothetical protein
MLQVSTCTWENIEIKKKYVRQCCANKCFIEGGLTALIAAKYLGARQGRFTDEDGEELKIPKEFIGHSIALQVRSFMAFELLLCSCHLLLRTL